MDSSGAGQFLCAICGYGSGSREDMKKHMNLFHIFNNDEEIVEEISEGSQEQTPDKKQRGRAEWNDSTTKLLIAEYKEKKDSVGKSKQFATYNKLYEHIAEEMRRKHSHEFTGTQIKQKWDALSRSYKDVVKSNSQTGQKRKRCSFQSELDDIFKKKKNIFPEYLADGKESWEPEMEMGIPETSAFDVDADAQPSTSKANSPNPAPLPSPALTTPYINSSRRSRSPMKKVREMLQAHHEERMEALQKWRQQKMAFQMECEKNRHEERLLLIEALREKKN